MSHILDGLRCFRGRGVSAYILEHSAEHRECVHVRTPKETLVCRAGNVRTAKSTVNYHPGGPNRAAYYTDAALADKNEYAAAVAALPFQLDAVRLAGRDTVLDVQGRCAWQFRDGVWCFHAVTPRRSGGVKKFYFEASAAFAEGCAAWDSVDHSHRLVRRIADGREYHSLLMGMTAGASISEARDAWHRQDIADARAARAAQRMQRLSAVFVSSDDSHASGNCAYGTSEFARKAWSVIAAQGPCAVRADVVLSLRHDAYTLRAVKEAAAR